MSLRPRGIPVTERGLDGPRRRWSESPIPRPGVRRVRAAGVPGYGWSDYTNWPSVYAQNTFAYGDQWVSVNYTGVYTATTLDGTWTYTDGAGITGFSPISSGCLLYWGAGDWVAHESMGMGGRDVYVAADPTASWSAYTVAPTGEVVYALGFDGTTWVALTGPTDGSTMRVMTATDPAGTWTDNGVDAALFGEQDATSIAYGDGTWIAIVGLSLYTSTDPAAAWTYVDDFTEATIITDVRAIVYHAGQWVAVTRWPEVLTAADPTTLGGWTALDVSSVVDPTAIDSYDVLAYGNGQWIAASHSSIGEGIIATDPTFIEGA